MHRGLLAFVACVAAAPEALAQTEDFDVASRFLDGERWNLDDGDDSVEWDDYDAELSYGPRGNLHPGVQLRLAALPGGAEPAPHGPLVELGGFLDYRYAATSPWRLRFVLAASYQPHAQANLGGGTNAQSSPFAVRLRVLALTFDLGRWISVRIGPDAGVQWVPTIGGGQVAPLVGGTAEVALMLLDGTLEIGITGGLQTTGIGRSTRMGEGTRLVVQGVLGGVVGYLWP